MRRERRGGAGRAHSSRLTQAASEKSRERGSGRPRLEPAPASRPAAVRDTSGPVALPSLPTQQGLTTKA